jgi:hypothetical protein
MELIILLIVIGIFFLIGSWRQKQNNQLSKIAHEYHSYKSQEEFHNAAKDDLNEFLVLLKKESPRQLGVRLMYMLVMRRFILDNPHSQDRNLSPVFEGLEASPGDRFFVIKAMEEMRKRSTNRPTIHNGSLLWTRLLGAIGNEEALAAAREVFFELQKGEGELNTIFSELVEDEAPEADASLKADLSYRPSYLEEL